MNDTAQTADEARERLRAMAFDLATSGGLVEPCAFDAALDAYRDALLAAAAPAGPAPATEREADALAKQVARAIWALKSPAPPGSQHYRSGWDDGLEAAMDAARDAVLAVLPAFEAALSSETGPKADSKAAVLLEAADRLWALANRTTERGAGVLWAAEWLRRLAGEAQPPAVDPAHAPGMPCEHGCRAAADELTRGAQQDPTQDGEERETDEQRADREETERDHAAGDHTHCGITCETELPTEHLRNFVIAKGYPGTKGALDELLRRAAAGGARQDPAQDGTAAHTGGNAEDCPACRGEGVDTISYPWECPGQTETDEETRS